MSQTYDNNSIDSVKEVLSRMGFTEPEIAVYLANLSTGTKPASVIAKKANLKRAHTYNVLEKLIDKGIVQEYSKNGIRHFHASSAISLNAGLENKAQEIKDQQTALNKVLPCLERMRNPGLSEPLVRYFRGIEGLQEIYEDTLRVKDKRILAVADFAHTFPEDKNSYLNKWMWKYADRRAAKGITYYGIVNKSAASDEAYKKRVKQKRKLKLLAGISLPVEINIYDDKVAIMSSSEDMIGVIIQDIPTATTLKNFHQAVWEYLPEYKL